jgi:hypothetical protein
MLLERLEASSDAVSKVRKGDNIEDLSDASWVVTFAANLESLDRGIQCRALKDAPTWKSEDLLSNPDALDAVFSLLKDSTPQHIRIRALRLINGIGGRGVRDTHYRSLE